MAKELINTYYIQIWRWERILAHTLWTFYEYDFSLSHTHTHTHVHMHRHFTTWGWWGFAKAYFIHFFPFSLNNLLECIFMQHKLLYSSLLHSNLKYLSTWISTKHIPFYFLFWRLSMYWNFLIGIVSLFIDTHWFEQSSTELA